MLRLVYTGCKVLFCSLHTTRFLKNNACNCNAINKWDYFPNYISVEKNQINQRVISTKSNVPHFRVWPSFWLCVCFFREGHSGGPEAIELEELKLREDTRHLPSPSLQSVGPLLREACMQLPSIRGCFLTHLAHLESSVLVSRDAILGRNPWISSHLLPQLTGPTLPSDWPFLPLVSLYERMGVSDGGGLAVEELPPGALQTVTHCLQWLLLLEIWREEALKVIFKYEKFLTRPLVCAAYVLPYF